MSKVKVLFFAADPSSADSDSPRLLLDEDVRRIRQKVRAADFRDHLEFDVHWAARADDLLQALNENPPQVVHFSGHGGSEGLVLVGAEGEPHPVDAAALSQLFHVFRGDIRVVVLSACFSLPQAEAIAQEVGCAIGTRGDISDEAAITFGAAFYRAIAFGHSVGAAFDQACTALALDHVADREYPVLVARPGVDPAQLVLIPRHSCPFDHDASGREAPPRPAPRKRPRRKKTRRPRWLVAVGVALLLVTGTLFAIDQARRTPPGTEPVPEHPAAKEEQDSAPGHRKAEPVPDSAPPAANGSGEADAAEPPARSSGGRDREARVDAEDEERSDLAIALDLYGEKDYAAAHPYFQRSAAAGSPEAMGYLGIMYLEGQGTPPRPDLALHWLMRAATAGDARGMNALGVAYERGEGVERSYREAMRWYQAAQAAGYAQAMNNIGTLYRQGWGVAQNYPEAMRWYRKGVNAGSAEAMTNLASMFEEGPAGPPDMAQALRWYRCAAEGGSLLAMVRLGLMYEHGNGVARDYAQALAWFTRAAEAGSAEGMYNLGVLYYEGRGVRRSRAEAIYWFRQAAGAGSTEASATLDALDAG